MKQLIILSIALFATFNSQAQINEREIGAWYMYFFNGTFGESRWGVQGDLQLRNWNMGGDLEQLLLRGGLTFKPQKANIKFTLGYGHVTTGAYGEAKNTTMESRIYQEALFPTQFGKRFYLTHRFRYEQRFVDNQNFRTRYRYNLFMNVALNKPAMEKGTLYLALYNELFINGERHIGNGNTVEIFDRNRTYGAIGYQILDGLKVQLGAMHQITNGWGKTQMQLSVHHKF